MPEVLRGETAGKSKEIEAPDLGGIMPIECRQKLQSQSFCY